MTQDPRTQDQQDPSSVAPDASEQATPESETTVVGQPTGAAPAPRGNKRRRQPQTEPAETPTTLSVEAQRLRDHFNSVHGKKDDGESPDQGPEIGLHGLRALTREMSRERRIQDAQDGKNAINIDLSGQTALGQFLHPASGFRFYLTIPGDETARQYTFNSVYGAVLWVKNQFRGGERAATASGRDAMSLMDAGLNTNWHRQFALRELVLELTLLRIWAYTDVKMMLIDNELPLMMWYDTKPTEGKLPERQQPVMSTWFLRGLSEIVAYLREVNRAADPKSVIKPNFSEICRHN